MTWGESGWGTSDWGTGEEGIPLDVGAIAPSTVSRRGGDVITIFGANLVPYVSVELLLAGEVVGRCYAFGSDVLNEGREGEDLRLYELTPSRLLVATPAMPDGTYDVRVSIGEASATLSAALTYELSSEEVKTQRMRQGMTSKWVAGRRLLTTGEALK